MKTLEFVKNIRTVKSWYWDDKLENANLKIQKTNLIHLLNYIDIILKEDDEISETDRDQFDTLGPYFKESTLRYKKTLQAEIAELDKAIEYSNIRVKIRYKLAKVKIPLG